MNHKTFWLFLIISALLCSNPSFAKNLKAGESTSNGRFQVLQLSEFRKDQILIDSQTGNLWRYSCANGETNCFWAKEAIEDMNFSAQQINNLLKKTSE